MEECCEEGGEQELHGWPSSITSRMRLAATLVSFWCRPLGHWTSTKTAAGWVPRPKPDEGFAGDGVADGGGRVVVEMATVGAR